MYRSNGKWLDDCVALPTRSKLNKVAEVPLRKAVFLDRDGVLNKAIIRNGKPHSPVDLSGFSIIDDAKEALMSLRRVGYLLIVATNQPNVGRQIQSQSDIELMHEKLKTVLPLDDIRVCYHDDHHNCSCRKPRPGLLLSAAKDWKIQLSESFMIGDRGKDLEAGRRAGCKTVLLKYSYNEDQSKAADYCAASLRHAVEWIIHEKPLDEGFSLE